MDRVLDIRLAVEDDLSEWVLRRILAEHRVAFRVGRVLKQGGNGYLKKRCASFNKLASQIPVLLLTDLDRTVCPPELLNSWLRENQHSDFLLRVAVREVEAWLLGCEEELGKFLGLKNQPNIRDPEGLDDPKTRLLELAESSPRRETREALCRRDVNGRLRQGPAYNSTLAEFVNGDWQPAGAAKICPSLARMMAALDSLEQRKRPVT